MRPMAIELLFWMPRVLAIMFAIFLSLFALDVFREETGFWRVLTALSIHLIPAAVVLLVLLISWRWEIFGAVLYTGLALLYIVNGLNRLPGSALIVISGPLLVIALLFLINWIYRDELHLRV